MNGQGMGEYCVDIVMCFDATGSMSPIIDEVKENAMSFYQRFLVLPDQNFGFGEKNGQMRQASARFFYIDDFERTQIKIVFFQNH